MIKDNNEFDRLAKPVFETGAGSLRSSVICMSCLLRQSEEAITLAKTGSENREFLYREIPALLAASDWNASPAKLCQGIQRIIRQRTGCADPYREMKANLNREAWRMLPKIVELKPEYMHVREAAVRVSIGGNTLDAGAKSGIQISDAINSLGFLFEKPLLGDWSAPFCLATEARQILFLTDNAGEIVFDRPLLDILPAGKVTVSVRGGPVINDATMEDAKAAGINAIARVISNGSDAPGTILDDCSPEFRDIFENSDLVIAKGQGNYETLCSSNKRILFLLQVKCPVIAQRTGKPIGSMLILQNQELPA